MGVYVYLGRMIHFALINFGVWHLWGSWQWSIQLSKNMGTLKPIASAAATEDSLLSNYTSKIVNFKII